MAQLKLALSQRQTGLYPPVSSRELYDEVLSQGHKVSSTFVDYSAAFATVSHKFLDQSFSEAGASVKSRAVFRAAVYYAARRWLMLSNNRRKCFVKGGP